MRTSRLLLAIALAAGAQPAAAALLLGDAANGRRLHDKHCFACHDARIYVRPNRRVKSVEGLMGQVDTCNRMLAKQFDKDELRDLVKYLNDAYYRFP